MWSTLFSMIGSGFTALFGGGSSGSNQTLVGQIVDKVLPETAKEVQEAVIEEGKQDIADVTSARAYEPTDMAPQPIVTTGIVPFMLTWILAAASKMVDVVNHMIRPGTFIWLAGGFSGLWKLPDPKAIDPQLWTIFEIVVTFYFGARTIVKDLPALFNAIKRR